MYYLRVSKREETVAEIGPFESGDIPLETWQSVAEAYPYDSDYAIALIFKAYGSRTKLMKRRLCSCGIDGAWCHPHNREGIP